MIRTRLAPVIPAFLGALVVGPRLWAQEPAVSEAVSPLTILYATAKDGHRAVAVVRKPPGQGPFPAVLLLHGGLDESSVEQLKKAALSRPTDVRLLKEGYVVATCTFRSRRQDPQTPAALWDCIALAEGVKKMPEVDPRSVVVFGGSGGGSLALELAGETDLCAAAAGEPATVLFTGMFTKDTGGGETGTRRAAPLMADPHKYYTPERQALTRAKIRRIRCPIFIAHGDQHPLKKINHEIFIPELRAAGKDVTVIVYPGEQHGFYWGQREAGRYDEFFSDLKRFFARHLPTKPKPLDAE